MLLSGMPHHLLTQSTEGVVIGGLGFHVGEIIDMYGHVEVEIAFQVGGPVQVNPDRTNIFVRSHSRCKYSGQ